MWAIPLAFAAGALTALSPCVLPVLPLVMGGAARTRFGPVALAAGFVAAFTAIGVALASVGDAIGLTDTMVRSVSGGLLVVAGAVMASHRLQDAMSRWLSPLATRSAALSMHAGGGLGGQFLVGLLLGGVWSPCVGPTLGAALGLAARGDTIAYAATIMLAFGAGSATLLLAAAYASRLVIGHRLTLLQTGAAGRLVLAALLIAVGGAVWSGFDKSIEAAALARLPAWWIELLASA